MNILVLNYEFPPIGGGASPVSRDLAAELVKNGHNVTAITMAYKGLKSEEIMDGISVYRVKCIRSKAFVCYPWEQLSYLISSYFFIKRLMKQGAKFDVVHTHFIIPTGVLAWWMNKKYGIKYVITAHGSDVMGYNQKRFKILHKILLSPWKRIVKAAETVVSPSLFLDELIKKQIPDVTSLIIPNGVDRGLFKELPKDKMILVMCRLQETKGVQTVIDAVACIEQMGDWKLCIAGDGPYRQVLEKKVAELDIEDRVEFKGWVENKSKAHVELVGKAAIYVSASRFENSPISVLEAMSAKCHVLLSDISPHRILMTDECKLFDMNNANELADKLAKEMKEFEMDEAVTYEEPKSWCEVAKLYERLLHDAAH